jgi:hypothetical protein
MTLAETFREFPRDKVVSLLIYEQDGKQFLPAFHMAKTCRDFCRRNLPREWVSGQAILTDEDVEALPETLEIKVFSYPQLLKDRVTWNTHIHWFTVTPDILTDKRGLIE